jgi:hypothetical protein
MFKTEEEQAAFKSAVFMTSTQEVRAYISEYLQGVAAEFKHLECEAVTSSSRGKSRVLSGAVGFSQSWSFTDTQGETRFEGVLTLGHAAFGPCRGARTVASVRRELVKQLSRSLPASSVVENHCSFTITLGDGNLVLSSMAGMGNSIIQIVTRVRNKGLRRA